MKTKYASALCCVLLLVLTLGCSNCRWPWEHRTVTAGMPPVQCPCPAVGATIGAPVEGCAPPAVPGATFVAPTPAPAAGPAPLPYGNPAQMQPTLPAQ